MNFYADMNGERPEGMMLGRADVHEGFYPENCIWTTPKEQARRRHHSLYLKVNGKWTPFEAAIVGSVVSNKTTRSRICKLHWSFQSAMQTPLMR